VTVPTSALTRHHAGASDALRRPILTDLARVYELRGDYVTAASTYTAVLPAGGTRDGPAYIALVGLGNIAMRAGRFAEARRHVEEGLTYYTEQGNLPRRAALLHNLAFCAQEQGELHAARRGYEEACALKRALCQQASLLIS